MLCVVAWRQPAGRLAFDIGCTIAVYCIRHIICAAATKRAGLASAAWFKHPFNTNILYAVLGKQKIYLTGAAAKVKLFIVKL